MAVVAIIAAGDMRRVLARRNNAIVAGAAGSNNLGVVDRESWNPDIGVMAVLANFCSQNVRRVFAGRFDTVVTARAIAGDADVIEIRRQPTGRRMAVIAIVAARDMCWMFTCRRRAVMARTASTDDLCVVDPNCRCKYVGVMAVLANVGGLNMRQALAGGGAAVMTTNAVARDADMIEVRR